MSISKKADAYLSPVQRPRCPKCQIRMMTAAVADGPKGLERRTFKCLKCAYTVEKTLASDPLKSTAAGWLKSELQPPK
jgi:tRNA(Ile2) C34 agmatinyltransferase TiaS